MEMVSHIARDMMYQLAKCINRIFIIEGCLTILVSLASLPVIPPFPEDCTFLSPEMKALMLTRINADGGHISDDQISFKRAFQILSDWKIWAGSVFTLSPHMIQY
jgi:hypothetical protein